MLWLLIYALSYLYSEPPMRLRSIYPIGHYVLSLVGVAAFLAGGLLIRSQSFFTLHGVSDLAGCIFISFFCLSHIKDLKDIEGDRRGNVMNVYNLTNYPRWIGMGAVVGFSVTLYFILQILAVYNSVVLMAIAGYLFVALLAILTAPDLRRLDWIIPFSMVLVVFISLVWLFGEWP
jgi:4-hydroxybenzoate polyprenyltransferase